MSVKTYTGRWMALAMALAVGLTAQSAWARKSAARDGGSGITQTATLSAGMSVTVTENADALDGPRTKGKKRFVVRAGDKVKVLRVESGWVKVGQRGKRGWVPRTVVGGVAAAAADDMRSVVAVYTARTGPDAAADEAFTVQPGDSYSVRAHYGDWAQIEDPMGRRAWVPAKALSAAPSARSLAKVDKPVAVAAVEIEVGTIKVVPNAGQAPAAGSVGASPVPAPTGGVAIDSSKKDKPAAGRSSDGSAPNAAVKDGAAKVERDADRVDDEGASNDDAIAAEKAARAEHATKSPVRRTKRSAWRAGRMGSEAPGPSASEDGTRVAERDSAADDVLNTPTSSVVSAPETTVSERQVSAKGPRGAARPGSYQLRLGAGAAYYAFTQTYRSAGAGIAGNYSMSTQAPALRVSGDLSRDVGAWRVGVEGAAYTTFAGSLGVDATSDGSDSLAYRAHGFDVGMRGSYALTPRLAVTGRAGWHLAARAIAQDPMVRMPSERLMGATVGVGASYVVNSVWNVDGGVETLLFGGLSQRAGEMDGTSSAISSHRASVAVQYRVRPRMVVQGTYALSFSSTSFAGENQRSTTAAGGQRTDNTQLVGIGAQFDF